jgi:hypothetical protein
MRAHLTHTYVVKTKAWSFFHPEHEMRGYASDIRARARDGIASHGTLSAHIRDFRASFKLFEMVTAERMAREHGRAESALCVPW